MCACVCVCVGGGGDVCMSVCMHECVHVCVCVSVCACVHVCVHESVRVLQLPQLPWQHVGSNKVTACDDELTEHRSQSPAG